MNNREFCLDILEKAGIPINSSEPWSMQVHDERVWDRVVARHQLGLGEAYIEGWWDCANIDQMLTRLLTIDATVLLRPSAKVIFHHARSSLLNHQRKSKAANNAKHHYNRGNELYVRMLDPEMAYSCGYWKDASTLNQAQINKFDLICRKLKLEPGMKLLDIGSGWGGLLRHAVKHYGVTGVGISPADEQIHLARELSAGLDIIFMQKDYRELSGQFDRVVSVGMMEHVGPKNLDTFFSTCNRLLKTNGIMLHHTISSTYSKNSTDAFFDTYIFPGGVLPSVAQIATACEKKFIIEDLHNFGLDYDKTLMAWYENINMRWEEIPHYDVKFVRMWNYYLLASAAGFRARNLQLNQMVFRRGGEKLAYIPER